MARTQVTGEGPLPTGYIAGYRHLRLSSVYHPASVRFAVTMFIAFWVTLVSCFGPATQALSASQSPNAFTLGEQDWLPPLLAREGHLEIVIIKPEGSCPEDFQTRFDFNLTAQQGPDLFRVCAEASALLIYPRIWIGSEGTDLVIRAQRSCAPIAILINDLDGGFDYSDFDPRSHSPKIRSPRMPAQSKQATFIVRARRTHRSIVDLSAGCRFCGVTILGRSPPPSRTAFHEIDNNTSQTRAPPPSLL